MLTIYFKKMTDSFIEFSKESKLIVIVLSNGFTIKLLYKKSHNKNKLYNVYVFSRLFIYLLHETVL